MKALLMKIGGQFNNLPKIARLVLIIAILFFLIVFAYKFVLVSMQSNVNNYEDKQAQAASVVLQLKSQILKAELEAKRIKANNNAAKISQLNNQLKIVEKQLNHYTKEYMPAGEIFAKLRGVLEQAKGLELVAVDHHTPEQIMIEENNNELQLWRHSLTLVFKGGFYHTLEYLKLITNLEMYLVIESLQYTVEKYPNAQIELVVSTITEKQK